MCARRRCKTTGGANHNVVRDICVRVKEYKHSFYTLLVLRKTEWYCFTCSPCQNTNLHSKIFIYWYLLSSFRATKQTIQHTKKLRSFGWFLKIRGDKAYSFVRVPKYLRKAPIKTLHWKLHSFEDILKNLRWESSNLPYMSNTDSQTCLNGCIQHIERSPTAWVDERHEPLLNGEGILHKRTWPENVCTKMCENSVFLIK